MLLQLYVITQTCAGVCRFLVTQAFAGVYDEMTLGEEMQQGTRGPLFLPRLLRP